MDCPNRLETGLLYRVTYPGQSCYGGGLIAKDPTASKSPLSHVNCGSKPGYQSQFLSFTTSLEVTDKYWAKAPPGARIVKVELARIPPSPDCKTYDLTVPMNRQRFLGNAVLAKNFAASDCEVLLWCKSRVPCTTIRGPSSDEDQDEL